MDHEDPIQQLLKNTGWSCDDLLQKLQRLQTQKDPTETQQTPSQSKTNDVSDERGLRSDPEEISSTLDLNLNTSDVQKPQQSIHTSSASTKVNDTFSDTDDEEQEVNATNTDIINEIIDDIYQTDEVKSECNSAQYDSSDINNTEITEVRVIEVNEEDVEKDQVREENLVNPEEIQYLEGYHHNSDYETITIETEPEDQSKPGEKKIDYVEVHPRRRYKIVSGPNMLLPTTLQKKQILSPKLKLLSKTSGPSPENQIHNCFRRKANPPNTFRRKFVIKKTIQKVRQWPKLPYWKTVELYNANSSKIVVSSNITAKTNTHDIDDLLPKTVISSKSSDYFSNKTVVISSNCNINKKSDDMEDVLPKTLISSESADVCTGSKEISPRRLSKSSSITSSVADSSLTTTVVSSSMRELPKYSSLIAGGITESPKIKKIPLPKKSIVSDTNPKFRIETQRFRQNNSISTVAVPQCPPKLLPSQPILEERLKKAEEKSKTDLGTTQTGGLSGTLLRTEDSEDERAEEKSTNVNTEEDIRNNLKLQLNSLRTKRRSQFFDTTSTKVIQNFECSRKLSLLASYESSNKEDTTAKPSKDDQNSINDSTIFEDHHSDLYTQTNELGLVILNVQGGIELDDFENDESQLKNSDKNKENTDNQIKKNDNDQRPDIEDTKSNSASDNEFDEEECRKADDSEQIRVFDQIRRIINKQKDPLKLSIETKSHNVSCKKLTSTIDEELKMEASSVSGENSQSSFTVESAEIDEHSVKKLTATVGDVKKMDITSISGENSQSSLPVESSEVEEKSPFVSDTLDEFLTASKLNISYQVPKLGAERGVKNITEESPLVLKKVENVKETFYDAKRSSIPKVKAKTVAQKRKLLERERKKELRRGEKKKLQDLKDRVKQVSKAIEDIKMKKGIENKENKFKCNENRDKSYILFNDNKIWVRSRSPNKCIARINCTREHRRKSETCQRQKWSLLKHARKRDCKLQYRPGPMCRKQDLQISGNDKWETRLLKLPKMLLEVEPTLGQPFCDTVLHRFANIIGGELDTNKIEFALSAVKSRSQIDDKKGQEPLSFQLEYHNKVEHALVRRTKKVTAKTETVSCPIQSCEVKNSSDTVADVIEDLIRYVEIKELAPTLIKNDDTQIKADEDELDAKLLSPVKDNITVFRKPNRKRSKIETELLRLSCKVVNVDIDENADEGLCTKPYCQLGCVCNSLKCEFILTRHCQKVTCMFDCTCPAEKPSTSDRLTFPAGTNVLSEESVTRIEDEAKRHLAKVERDFTQTVIHTSDKTIVVGIGDRTKMKRAAKVPAKFSDFVSSSNAICEESTYSKRCIVSLPNLNLSELIPYCLTHNLYSCHCNGLDLTRASSERDRLQPHEWFEGSDTNTKIKIEPKSRKVRNDKSKRDTTKTESKRFIMPDVIEMKNIKSDTENSSLDESWSPSRWVHSSISNVEDLSKRPRRNIKKRELSGDYVGHNEQLSFISLRCARARPVAKKYTKRSLKYNESVFQDDFIFHIKDADLLRATVEQDQDLLNIPVSDADLLKKKIVQEKLLHRANQSKDKEKRKRPSEFNKQNIRSANKSFNADAAIQRRRKVAVQSRKSVEIETVFDGEIIIDERNMDLLKKMGPKTVTEGYARLLPWTALISSYQNKSINIWSMIDQPSRLLINKAAKKCPKNYVNINESSQATEVILWIKKNKLPSHYQEDSLSFILRETKDNFEICGICTKNITFDGTISDRGEIFYHKDLNGVERFFILKKRTYRFVELAELVLENEISTIPQLRMALPKIFTICKWRMIFLNSDFTFLFFKGIPYSIRYTDLLAICDYAKKNKCTVWLKNKEMQKYYSHKLFGVYFDPRFADRIFIGPYFKNHKDNDIETLRYINQSLVSTESFNKMRGKGDYKCGHWLVETKKQPTSIISLSDIQTPLSESIRSESPVSEKSRSESAAESMTDFLSESTIDLTSDGEEDISEQRTISEISKHPSDTQEYYPFAPVIMHNNQEVKIIDAPPRTPEDFNRYIITNIPHFGYLGAFTHPAGEIDVSWPFENKLLRFCSETSATSFLQDRFTTLLQAVPETFKINIIVALKIDLLVSKPIDSRVLSGHFICGDFGYIDILDVSDEDCRSKVGVPKEEILKLFSKRAKNFIKKKIETLSYLLQIKRNRAGGYDLSVVLTKAAEEIRLQMKRDKENRLLKNTLFLKKRDNAIKLHHLISLLPIDQRNIENLKFRAILHKNAALPIEIQDSDDEPNRNDDADKVKTSETKPSTSTSSTNNADPLEVFKSPPPLSYINKSNSVLKKLVSVPIDAETSLLMRAEPKSSKTDSDTAKFKCIKGVKLVKNHQGGFVLVNDANKNTEDSSHRTEVIIQDSTLFSMSKTSAPTSTKLSVTSFDHMSIGEAIIIDLDKNNGSDGKIPELTLTSNNTVEINELSSENVGKDATPSDAIINLDDSEEVNETEDDDDDVIHIDNEPMIIDLDEIPSDDELETVQQSQAVITKDSIKK